MRARLLDLPLDILRLIIKMLNARDYRLSLTCKLLHGLFNEEWYQAYWKIATQKSHSITSTRINWAMYYHLFHVAKYADQSDAARELCRLIENNDTISAMMTSCNLQDILQGKHRSPLLMAHQAKMTTLLNHFYLIAEEHYQALAANEGKYSLLHLAVYCFQSAEVIKHRIENGNDINGKTDEGDTPLHIAAYSGQYNLIKNFLQSGAEVSVFNNRRHSPLHAAISSKNEKMVSVLIDGSYLAAYYGDIIPVLFYAIEVFPACVSILLANGAATRYRCSFTCLHKFHNIDPYLRPIRDRHIQRIDTRPDYVREELTAIQLAEILGRDDIVRLLENDLLIKEETKRAHCSSNSIN